MTPCPTLGKGRYSTAAEALAGARGNRLMRPYPCDCGIWHLATRGKKKRRPMKRGPKINGSTRYRIYYKPTTKWVT